MKKDFIIPLYDEAINIIREIKLYSFKISKFVFPSATSTLNDGTLNQVLMRLRYKDRHTTHGFRSSFSTNTHKNIHIHKIHSDVIESYLAHEEKKKTC